MWNEKSTQNTLYRLFSFPIYLTFSAEKINFENAEMAEKRSFPSHHWNFMDGLQYILGIGLEYCILFVGKIKDFVKLHKSYQYSTLFATITSTSWSKPSFQESKQVRRVLSTSLLALLNFSSLAMTCDSQCDKIAEWIRIKYLPPYCQPDGYYKFLPTRVNAGWAWSNVWASPHLHGAVSGFSRKHLAWWMSCSGEETHSVSVCKWRI